MQSLTAKGMPVNGVTCAPVCKRRSAWRACSKASSSATVTKALMCGSVVWIWSRVAVVNSRLLTCLLERRSWAARMERLNNSMRLLFVKHQRYLNKGAILVGHVLHEVLARHGRLQFVKPHDIMGTGGFTGWFHILRVHFVKQVEIVDDGRKLVAKGLGLLFQNAQANKECHVFNHICIDGKTGFGWFLRLHDYFSLI